VLDVPAAASFSDAHMGKFGSRADDCNRVGLYWLVEAVISLLLQVLVGLGDLLELWQFALQEILASPENRQLLAWIDEQLYRHNIVFVYKLGNHDDTDPVKLYNALRVLMPKCDLRVTRGSVLVAGWWLDHGHRWDRWNAKGSILRPVARGITWLAGWPERAFPGFDENWLNPRRFISPAARRTRAGVVHDSAELWAATLGKRLCYGHTHRPHLHHEPTWAVVNDGCCVGDQASFASVYLDGTANLHFKEKAYV
jgi:UDP-2,3-diacylglucosamine pyrophosphatase LpxH